MKDRMVPLGSDAEMNKRRNLYLNIPDAEEVADSLMVLGLFKDQEVAHSKAMIDLSRFKRNLVKKPNVLESDSSDGD